jgi:hypothetical protein
MPEVAADPKPRGFDHIVLTRFNIAGRRPSRFDKGLDEEWLAHRTGLFRRFCFPSVLNQSEKNFSWLVLLHAGTPPRIRGILDECSRSCPQMRLVYVPVLQRRNLSSIVKRLTTSDYLITSRLDNDDALAVNFVETVQKAFRPAKLEFINFPNVACYDAVQGRFYTRLRRSNPFLSLVEERTEAPKTAMFLRHPRAESGYAVRNVRTRTPMALAVTHERNLANTADGCLASPREMRKHFAIDIEFPEEPPGLLLRQLTCRLRRGLRKPLAILRR